MELLILGIGTAIAVFGAGILQRRIQRQTSGTIQDNTDIWI